MLAYGRASKDDRRLKVNPSNAQVLIYGSYMLLSSICSVLVLVDVSEDSTGEIMSIASACYELSWFC